MLRHLRFTVPGELITHSELYSLAPSERALRLKEAKEQVKDGIHQAMSSQTAIARFTGPVRIELVWIRSDMRRTKADVAYAKDLIAQALKEEQVIEGDSWELCTMLDRGFATNPSNPRTAVIVTGDNQES